MPARRACALLVGLLLAPLTAAAQSAGQVTHVSGAFMATAPNGSSRILAPNSAVNEGDTLSTATNAYARVKFSDGGEVTLRPGTQLQIEAYRFQERQPQGDSFVMNLLRGGLRSVTGLLGKRRPESYRMNTPVATIGIRGTHYGALFCQGNCAGLGAGGSTPKDGLHVDVAEGAVALTNQGGQTVLTQGSFGYVPSVQAPPQQVPPSQGITVTAPVSSAKPGAIPVSASGSSPLTEDCIP